MRYIKYCLLIGIILLLGAIFAGCIEAYIIGKISDDNIASMTYYVNINTQDMTDDGIATLSDALNILQQSLKDMELESVVVNKSTDTDNIAISVIMENKCTSREEAYKKLFEYMTSSFSVFDQVEYNYNIDYCKETNQISGIIDLSQLISREEISLSFPKHIIMDIYKASNNAKATLSFELPDNESSESKTFCQKILFSEPTNFSVSSTINNTNNSTYESNEINISNNYRKRLILFTLLSIILMLIFLTFAIVVPSVKKELKIHAALSE